LNHRRKSPGSSNRSIYIRRHISTSGNAQLVAKRARPKSMEDSSLHQDNKLRKSYYFCTETLISWHKCSDRLQSTPYFHFRLGVKCRQTCTAWDNGKNSYDHCHLNYCSQSRFCFKALNLRPEAIVLSISDAIFLLPVTRSESPNVHGQSQWRILLFMETTSYVKVIISLRKH